MSDEDYAWSGFADEEWVVRWFEAALAGVPDAHQVDALDEFVEGASMLRAWRVLIGPMRAGSHNQAIQEGAFATLTEIKVAWYHRLAVDSRRRDYHRMLRFQTLLRRTVVGYYQQPLVEPLGSDGRPPADEGPRLPGFSLSWAGADRPSAVDSDVMAGALTFQVSHAPSLVAPSSL